MDPEADRLLADTQDDELEDITAFASKYNLEPHLPLLLKAYHSLQADANSNFASELTFQEQAALSAERKQKWRQPLFMYLCILVTALGAMGQGWAQTGINGANLYYPKLFRIGSDSARDTFLVGIINAGIYLSNGLFGSWLVAPLNGRFGRRGTVFIGAVISLVFNVAGSAADSWRGLLICRLALGVGLALIAGTLNIFAAESTPAAIRGGLGVAWQMFCAFGIFIAFYANMRIDSNPEAYGPLRWRMMLLAAAIPTIPLILLIFLCPESPSWLVKQSERYDEAFKSLCYLRNSEIQAARELVTIYLQRKKNFQPSEHKGLLKPLFELLTVPRIRRATLAAYSTMLGQQLTGVNIVAFFSSSIFVQANFSPYAAELASTIFGLVNFLGAIPAIWAMDSLGRRSLLLITLLPMALTMIVAGIAFSLSDSSQKLRFYLSTSMIYLFCLFYSPGMGPVPAAYSAEVFPLSHRELGTSSAVAVTNLFAALLSLTFPYLLSVLGSSGSFILYGLLNVVAWIIIFLFVPETKRKTLDELDDVFAVPTSVFIRIQILNVNRWSKKLVLRR